MAIGDGAGSALRSREGADVATRAFCDAALRAMLAASGPDDWEALVLEAFKQARNAVIQYAERESAPVRSFATTLCGVVATEEVLVAAQVGDGIVVVLDAEMALRLLLRPQRGQYANEVPFLTSDGALDGLDIHVRLDRPLAFAALTDGLLHLAVQLPSYTPHEPFFLPLFALVADSNDIVEAEQHLQRFLSSERVNARTDDDKTLVIASRRLFTQRG
jgi:hypothetical protein